MTNKYLNEKIQYSMITEISFLYHNEDGLNIINKHFWQVEKNDKLSPARFRGNYFFFIFANFSFFQLNYLHIVCKWFEIWKTSVFYCWSKNTSKLRTRESKWKAFCWFYESNNCFQSLTCCHLQTRHN